MRLLSPGFVEKWDGRILNIHPSLLPLHKGLDTHRRALVAGDEYAGCSVHLVTAELDSGPVIAQAKVRILPRDDPESLAARVLEEEHRLYPIALDEYCPGACGQPRRMTMTTDGPGTADRCGGSRRDSPALDKPGRIRRGRRLADLGPRALEQLSGADRRRDRQGRRRASRRRPRP